ncbi:MAG: hypothetical protein H7Z19_12790 [Chitinophagaceae bacterium]|nr:hypothetical protein [Rubrivivax sp.]
MNSHLVIRLQTTPDQHAKLQQLQAAFAAVCNAVAPMAQRTTCWNRVALHHQAYRPMRRQFPALGSQMVCNAVYSVSRACRLIYQHPQSPFNLQRMAGRPLPVLHFLPGSPVYFDRHTLSLKDGTASMYTLDGRMRFNLPLSPPDQTRFRETKLREIVLFERDGGYLLSFRFAEDEEAGATAAQVDFDGSELPEYLLVLDGSGPGAAQSQSERDADRLTSVAGTRRLPRTVPESQP